MTDPELTREQKVRLKQIELVARQTVKIALANTDTFGIEPFGEDKFVLDRTSLYGLLVFFAGRMDAK